MFPDGNGGFEYQFRIADHLNNTRVMFSDGNSDGVVTEDEIITENNYYPGGLEMSGVWTNATTPLQPYTYSNKEYNDDYELGLLDYGARCYDPAKVLWDGVDRFSEKYYFSSPYNFTLGNPINSVDIEGDSVALIRSLKAKGWLVLIWL